MTLNFFLSESVDSSSLYHAEEQTWHAHRSGFRTLAVLSTLSSQLSTRPVSALSESHALGRHLATRPSLALSQASPMKMILPPIFTPLKGESARPPVVPVSTHDSNPDIPWNHPAPPSLITRKRAKGKPLADDSDFTASTDDETILRSKHFP